MTMTSAWAILALTITFTAGVYAGCYAGVRIAVKIIRAHPEIAERFVEANRSETAETPEPAEGFPVARTDRRPTWRQRRKQLEAAARKERERIEAWRG